MHAVRRSRRSWPPPSSKYRKKVPTNAAQSIEDVRRPELPEQEHREHDTGDEQNESQHAPASLIVV